ncbi:MAG: A/G-specific adenine glycosylase [Candidatus Eremiobacteraeota bacterium]|nr:A/G-specific adenine glycosylase [Candidatus Eremiobacteraeota bacterium]
MVSSYAKIRNALLAWYASAGRAHLPWRSTRDPYCIVVSETMLQQTQVDRVLPKYLEFLQCFPTFEALASSSTANVLRLWKGLGYNSRAVRLQKLAREVVARFGGSIPQNREALASLPGLGPYTIAAVRAFAFDLDDAAIDTNVRRVTHRVLHGIEFPQVVSARALDGESRSLVPPRGGHAWNSAMMDLGATICTARAPKCLLCPLKNHCAAAPVDAVELERLRKKHAAKRSPQESLPFEQTTRFVRGRIVDRLRELPPGGAISFLDLYREVDLGGRTADDVRAIVGALKRDGLVTERNERYSLQD